MLVGPEAPDAAGQPGGVTATRQHPDTDVEGPLDRCRDAIPPARQLVGAVPLVASEVLVARVAVQRHRYPLSGHLGEVIRRNGGGVGERLVVVPDDLGKDRGRIRLDHELVMIGAVSLGHQTRPRQLVVLRILEPDGEGLHRPRGELAHQRHDRARVDAAAQARAQGHVGDQPATYGFAQVGSQRLARFGLRDPELRAIAQPPIPHGPHATRVDLGVVRRGQLAHTAERRAGRRHVPEGEVMMDRVEIGLRPDARIDEDAFGLRGEQRLLVVHVVVQRLLPGAIADERQRSATGIPHREGEHAAEPL